MSNQRQLNIMWNDRAQWLRMTAIAVLITPASLLGMSPAPAAEIAYDDRFNLAVGAYFVTNTNAQIRLDRVTGPIAIGTSIDWERDLGGDTSLTVPRVDGYYRFAPKHRVDFSWYNVDRRGLLATSRGIDFGNVSFPAGTTLDSHFTTNTLKLAYTYSFYRAPEIETALSLGVHVTQLDVSLTAVSGGISEAESTTAPLPVFGYRLDYVLSPKWLIRTKYELFFLDSVDAYQGTLSDFTLAVEHRTLRHLGFGFGLNRSSLNIDVSKNNLHGAFGSVLNGFMLYAVVR
jgi:hypothetical protein